MLRQLWNLKRLGRLRTNAPTRRSGKPGFLRRRPDLEVGDLLEFVVANHGRAHEDFFFVQIGAFDGRVADPLFHLVQKHNWRGVLVEPQPDMFDKLQENYAGQEGLQFFPVAIGARSEEIEFYTRRTGGVQVASACKHLLVKPGHPSSDVKAIKIPCWTFQNLMHEAGDPPHIDLLQIDAEGWDFEIIRSIDFERYRPSILRYEHMVLTESERDECLELLASHGYRFILEDVDTTAILKDAARKAA